MGSAPVEELEAGRRAGEQLAGGRAAQRGPRAPERVGVDRRVDPALARGEAEQVEVALHVPALPAQVREVAARREAQLLRLVAATAADHGLAVGMVGHA